ncbi:MAG: PAS domain S-box protein [Opitutaceae bacterium]|nr:PAS domain S-box protein [Opitutaceae bacterium]
MSKTRIFVVEDEVIVARDIMQQLGELGYEAIGSCTRGEEALVQVDRLRPDLVLMDIQLAGAMDGIATAKLVRERMALPVVFLTAFAETETLNRAKLSEPFGYILKPFDERELRTVIEIALFKHQSELNLRASEDRFRSLVETSLDAVLLTGPDGRVLDANAAACAMFQLPLEEFRRRGRDAVVDPADRRLAAAFDERRRTGRFRGEITMVRANGEKFPAEISSAIFRTSNGEERNSLVIRDVTEQRRAEALLRLQGAALGAAANAIVITDRKGVIEWANQAFTDLTGYGLGEVIGREPGELIKSGVHGEDYYQDMRTTILAGRVWRREIVNRNKAGQHYYEEMTITPVRDGGGEISHFIAIKQDITERKRVLEALRQSEERYRLLFDRNPAPMWLYDAETLRFVAVNETAVRNYGYTEEEFLGLTIAQIRPEEDLERFIENVHATRDEPLTVAEWRHRRKDGSIIHVEVMSRPLLFNGRPARLVMASDITEKKQLQEQFLRAQRLESLGMLASGIAHDLNNMLAPILFAGPLLRTSVSSPRDLRILETLEKSAERGSGLVRQILAFAQGTSAAPRITQLKHIARDVVSIVEASFPKNITLEQHIASNAWPVQANPTQIHQVLLNLCVNARDAMPQGGTLAIRVGNRHLDADEAAGIPDARAGDWLVLEVADTGTGIPADIVPRIWESFFTTKAPGKGTGLGLATVRSIVNAHMGFVGLETEVGKGTTFRIFLPASRDPESKGGESGSPFPVPAATREELILVVDDDASVREIIAAVLAQHDYRVVTCADGVEAIVNYNAKSRDIALVITDVDMPNLGGAILAATLRRLNPQLRIIAMSGLSSAGVARDDVEEIKRIAAAFLPKPFSATDLLAVVHRVLHPEPKG